MPGVRGTVQALKELGIDFACIIPCISIKDLIEAVEAAIPTFKVTREEEAVGLCAGAYLAGKRPLIVMQNSGLGNSVNALKSLIQLYGIPLLMIISHRGQEGELIEGQVPMGEATTRLLDALDIPYFAPEAGDVEASLADAWDAAVKQGPSKAHVGRVSSRMRARPFPRLQRRGVFPCCGQGA